MRIYPQDQQSIKQTYVTIMLDDSASMQGVRQQTIDGFNEQLSALRALESLDHEVFVTIIKFSDPSNISTLRNKVSPKEIRPLELHEYTANGGSTALLDAMDYTIRNTAANSALIDNINNAALVIFITDGGENNSYKIKNRALIKEQIESLTGKGNYTFTYMGVGSIEDIQNGFGISGGNQVPFQYGKGGMVKNLMSNSSGIHSYMSARASGATASADFYSNPIVKVLDGKEEDSSLNPSPAAWPFPTSNT